MSWLIFLKYVSDRFSLTKEKERKTTKIAKNLKEAYLNDKTTYKSKGVFFIPEDSNWEYLEKNASKSNIPSIVDAVLERIEYANEDLRGVLWKDYTRQNIDPAALGELINIFSNIKFEEKDGLDLLGRVYEYFIGQFADSEGRRGGEYYTPLSLVKTIVGVVAPKETDIILDPACGSGGLLIESSKYISRNKGNISKTTFNGQEYNDTTQKLAKMNMAVHGMKGEVFVGNTYYDDKFKNTKADIVIANPPFNDNWNSSRLSESDSRIKYGLPNEGSANYIWIQHFIHHMSENSRAGFVMANGALSVGGKEGVIREKIIKDNLVEVIISCPSKLFYNVSIPSSLWFLSKQNSKQKVLFIDATQEYNEVSKKHNEFTEENIQKIITTITNWRIGKGYKDISGFCKSVSCKEIEKEDYTLSPGRYVEITGKKG